jgi:inhibitor of KinA sporulation pathway (predicted exonuclease)
MPNVTVTLNEAEQIQLEEILIDHDEKAALEFLKRAVKPKVELRLKSHCRPEFEGPSMGMPQR